MRISVAAYDALFRKWLLRRNIAVAVVVVVVSKRNIDLTQENLARRSRRYCNQNRRREVINSRKIERQARLVVKYFSRPENDCELSAINETISLANSSFLFSFIIETKEYAS